MLPIGADEALGVGGRIGEEVELMAIERGAERIVAGDDGDFGGWDAGGGELMGGPEDKRHTGEACCGRDSGGLVW